MFDIVYFLKIIAWFGAIGGTSLAILGLYFVWAAHYTKHGRTERLLMNLKGQDIAFRWAWVWIALVSWIALASFR